MDFRAVRNMEYSNRKSPRIPRYDYATPNYYFITICTHHKECIFGRPGRLNAYGKIAEENLLKIPELFSSISIEKYVVMPNHIHGIFSVSDSGNKELKDLSVILGQYKMSVTKKIRTMEPERIVWQRSFHDHVIRNQRSYEKIWTYIDNNPQKWEEDCFFVASF